MSNTKIWKRKQEKIKQQVFIREKHEALTFSIGSQRNTAKCFTGTSNLWYCKLNIFKHFALYWVMVNI